ncbi:MAG: hypothetical protein ABSE81_07095 [Candidatus Omnitrophota bacterium]|jgi:hypothetical protein
MIKRIAGIIICFLCFTMPLRAEIPLPEDATLVKAGEPDTSPMHLSIKMYRTSLSLNKLNDFFSRAMQQAGWHEDKSAKGSLRFQNGQRMAMIFPLPTLTREGRIAFTVTEGKVLSKEDFVATQKDKPDALIFMPPYPNAKQMYLWDLPTGGVSAAYITTDAIQDVLFFYKAKMLDYGWFLAEEAPIVRTPISYDSKGIKTILAKEHINAKVKAKGEEEKASLTFKKSTGESCFINLFSTSVDADSFLGNPKNLAAITANLKDWPKTSSERRTEILVTYNEVKKLHK